MSLKNVEPPEIGKNGGNWKKVQISSLELGGYNCID